MRVLTSSENLRRIEEKEKKKEKNICEKRERAMLRRAKQLQRDKQKSKLNSVTSFSESELLKFSQRYENGYDVTTDEHYNEYKLTIQSQSQMTLQMILVRLSV